MDRFIQMGFSPILYGKTLQTVIILTIRTSTETLPILVGTSGVSTREAL